VNRVREDTFLAGRDQLAKQEEISTPRKVCEREILMAAAGECNGIIVLVVSFFDLQRRKQVKCSSRWRRTNGTKIAMRSC